MRTSRNGLAVLLVEDDPGIALVIQTTLERDGHTLRVCGTARETRDALDEGLRPDVVLLDLLLPDAPGTTLVKQLRQVAGRIVAMSSNRERLREAEGLVDNTLPKPFVLAELRALMTRT